MALTAAGGQQHGWLAGSQSRARYVCAVLCCDTYDGDRRIRHQARDIGWKRRIGGVPTPDSIAPRSVPGSSHQTLATRLQPQPPDQAAATRFSRHQTPATGDQTPATRLQPPQAPQPPGAAQPPQLPQPPGSSHQAPATADSSHQAPATRTPPATRQTRFTHTRLDSTHTARGHTTRPINTRLDGPTDMILVCSSVRSPIVRLSHC